MPASVFTEPAVRSGAREARGDGRTQEASVAPRVPLFVIPCTGGRAFRASIRGHELELADPDSAHGLAPTPEDLLAAAVASDVAWFARRFLRDHALDDYVSVAAWSSAAGRVPIPSDLDIRVEVSERAAVIGRALTDALEQRFAVHSPRQPRFEVRAG